MGIWTENIVFPVHAFVVNVNFRKVYLYSTVSTRASPLGLLPIYEPLLNGCRESIEHMFRDMAEYWNITASYKLLKMLNGGEAVLNLFDMCFVFNNLWNCKYHNQTSQWFENPPPTLQVYLGAGRRAVVAHVP